VTTISLNNSPVVLSAAQFQSKTIIFNSTLTGSVTITFPSSYQKSYEIRNICTGSSAFVVTLQTTVAGANAICAPPGENTDIFVYAGSLFYRSLDRIGTYWDYAGSSVPAWVSGCTVPPYLNCDGSTFSATTYPQLAVILGSTTLPDSKGSARFALDQGAGRLSSVAFGAGFNSSTVGSRGGSQFVQAHNHTVIITDPGHDHFEQGSPAGGASNHLYIPNNGTSGVTQTSTDKTATATTGITAVTSNFGAGNSGNIPPAYIGGLTLIRAG
jgi:hypothetical protein